MAPKKRRKKSKSKKAKSTRQGTPEKALVNQENKQNSRDTGPDYDEIAVEIRRLVLEGKSKTALSRAKEIHKHLETEKSEDLLKETYIARILEMAQKGYMTEAASLLDMVRGKYDFPDEIMMEIGALVSVRSGQMDELLVSLNDPSMAPESRKAIEKAIRNEVTDLKALAHCETLSEDHSLRKEAGLLFSAFDAVTRGNVKDEDVTLPGISRKSPLAPWKMLIKGIDAFYRFDDELCVKCLDAVDPASAPARVVPAVRAMLSENDAKKSLGKKELAFMAQVRGNETQLERAFRNLDGVMAQEPSRGFSKDIRKAIWACEKFRPELLEKLKQHISVGFKMIDYVRENVNEAMGGAPVKNAEYWRLYARAKEVEGEYILASALWSEFLIHAIHEGLFSADGIELSAVYLHMADLLAGVPEYDFKEDLRDFKRSFEGFEADYEQQPESVLKAVRRAKRPKRDPFFLNPEKLHKMACDVDPTSENFSKWLALIENKYSSWKKSDPVALAWHEAVPNDVRPLLYLTRSAEKRNAFQKSMGYLNEAEALDGLSSEVKNARRRLLVSTAVRHLKQKKIHLAEKDVMEMEKLPQFSEGDRPAFVEAMKCISAMINGAASRRDECHERVVQILEDRISANMILDGLIRVCGTSKQEKRFRGKKEAVDATGEKLFGAVARGCRLGRDMGISVFILPDYSNRIMTFLGTAGNSVDAVSLGAVAEAALLNAQLPLAYAVSGAGLKRRDASLARFLLLRARSFPEWAPKRRNDCIDAALAFARRERDMPLIDEALELRRRRGGAFSFFSPFADLDGDPSMDTDQADDILKYEIEDNKFPSRASSKNMGLPLGFWDEEDDDDDDWDDDDDDWDDEFPDKDLQGLLAGVFPEMLSDELGNDIPPEAMSILFEIAMKYTDANGDMPDPEVIFKKNPKLMQRFLDAMGPSFYDGLFEEFIKGESHGSPGRKKKQKGKGRKR